ncbi:TetR/AcrR family transcriptional regulator [Niveibacterium microcysteis]|uniref:TetR/AcrR family transcriptional regulator n=1 Tax=Niveibacterium microcysteis TaxID=2811415 RepID=A0ABX7M4C8_9RHOO|nr:TetR/AcrR family transcriptional regulator [Niveibacterium microcysteis]QSI75628.1 TetR/AcrR family transcriptional regulator [Niveibacterium microcysteis]
MTATAPTRPSFKQRQFEAREDAILDAAHELLATKGYDQTTVDEVAAAVGIAKASLYKHFPSKEVLATAAMKRMIQRALTFIDGLSPSLSADESLRAVLEWALRLRLAGGLPTLPSSNSALVAALTQDEAYVALVTELTGRLGLWVQFGKALGKLRADLPDEVILLSFYARTCDPAIDFLKRGGTMDDETIVQAMLKLFFDGVRRSA